jgi:hypothetical protein
MVQLINTRLFKKICIYKTSGSTIIFTKAGHLALSKTNRPSDFHKLFLYNQLLISSPTLRPDTLILPNLTTIIILGEARKL